MYLHNKCITSLYLQKNYPADLDFNIIMPIKQII